MDPVARVLRSALVVGAVSFVGAFAFVSLSRISYPYALAFMEGGMVDHVRWILAGNPLYGPPSIDFTPYGYAPIYTYLSAGLSQIVGVGFVPLRLVSIASTFGAFAMLYLMAKRESGSALAGILAMSMYAAAFKLSDYFFDVGGSDSLFIFMLLVSLYLVRSVDTKRQAIVAGLVFASAVFVKQTALSFSLPILLYLIIMRRPLFLYFALPFAAVVVSGVWLLDWIHDGWSSFYLFQLYSNAGYHFAYFGVYLKEELFLLDQALLIGLIYLLSKAFWQRDLDAGAFYFLVLGSAIGLCGFARSLSLGSHEHVMMPVQVMISLVFGLGVAEALSLIRLASAQDQKWQYWSWFLLVVCILQFARLVYYPPRQIPTAADREAGAKLVEWIRNVEGDVFLPDFGYLNALAGKQTFVQTVAVYDSLSADRTRPYMEDALRDAIASDRFEVIISGEEGMTRYPWVGEEIRKHFVLEKASFFEDDDVFRPVVAYPHRPTQVFRRKGLTGERSDF